MLVPQPRLEISSLAPFDVISEKRNTFELLLVFGMQQSEGDDIRVAYGLLEVREDGFGFFDDCELFLEYGWCILEDLHCETLFFIC